jgi:flagellar motor protein MotB
MRTAFRRFQQEEEEESAFVSMTDMTVSFLFVIMILLAFFATQFSDDDSVPRTQLEEMRDQRNVAREERDAARTEVERLTALLQQALRERDEALKEVAARDAEIERLKQRILELETRIEELQRKDPLEAYLSRAAATRLRILEQLRERLQLDFPNLMIEISAESDALRFQGEGLFETNESALRPGPRRIVETIAARLDEILPCYTLGPASSWTDDCNPGLSVIEAVQIEGHTDSQGQPLNNLILSTARANATFAAMLETRPDLTDHQNYRDQPVLSVAGYGQMRPVASNESIEERATNRRIDLRIIMHTPAGSQEIDMIRERLEAAGPEAQQ